MEARRPEESAWKEQLERIIEIIAEGIVIVGRDGRFVFANAAAERVLGVKRSGIIGKTFADLKMKVTTVGGKPMPEEDLHFTKVMQIGKPIYDLEHVHERPDGTKVIVSASAVPLLDKSGNILVVVNSFNDITDRKKAEEELKTLSKRIQLVLESVVEGIFLIDSDGRLELINRAASEMTGYRPEESLGKNFHVLIRHSRADCSPYLIEECPVIHAVKAGRSIHVENDVFWRKDGTHFPVEYTASPFIEDDIAKGAVVSFTDIAERKKAEEELKESERRFREMLEKAELVAVMLDTQGRITFINDYLLNLTGWQRDEVVGKDWFNRFIPPEQQGQLKDFFFESIAKGEIQAHHTNDIITSWDERRTILFTNVLLRDLQGNIIGTASIGEDVTERERAAEEIRESRRQVLDVLESMTDGFVAVDTDWRFTYVNTKAAQLLRRRKEELLFRTMWDAFPGVEDTTFGKEFKRAVGENNPVVFEEFYQPVNKWFEVHAFPYKMGLSIYFRDISERKKREIEYKRKDELSDALNNINAILSSALDFGEIMQRVIVDSARAIGAESAAIELHEDDRWVVRYVYGLPQELIGMQLTDEEAKAAMIVLKTKKQFISNDAYSDERLNAELIRRYSLRSLLAIPLIVKGKVIGILIFSYLSAPVAFSELEADFANKLAVSVSLVL